MLANIADIHFCVRIVLAWRPFVMGGGAGRKRMRKRIEQIKAAQNDCR